MRSLTSRLLLAVSLSFTTFLGLTGYALDQAFQQHTEDATAKRLENYVYTLVAIAEIDDDAIRVPANMLLEVDFHLPNSGLYARITGNDDHHRWQSGSLVDPGVPEISGLPPTRRLFTRVRGHDGREYFVFAFAFSWDTPPQEHVHTVNIIEAVDKHYLKQVREFRRSLFSWLGAVTLALLLVIGLAMRWSLQPLRRAAHEIKRIEQGQQDILRGDYPKELRGLTENINGLIQSSQARLERYRNSSADLAHSLKTPLALLQGLADSHGSSEELRRAVAEQIRQINQIVEYQLQRAATSGRNPLTQPVNVYRLIEKVVNSLNKVYASKGVKLQILASRQLLFHGDESDLLEVTGNLLDNAFKWCRQQVVIQARILRQGGGTRLQLVVEDDGPGIDPRLASRVIERGVRSDGHAGGSGIGLAVVNDIAQAYHGTLHIDQSPGLHGARFQLTLTQ